MTARTDGRSERMRTTPRQTLNMSPTDASEARSLWPYRQAAPAIAADRGQDDYAPNHGHEFNELGKEYSEF